ncbi:MAG: LysE family transporter [Pyramidobacter sp.]|nr:LysE family transporter [Pyramidobacter sp.]
MQYFFQGLMIALASIAPIGVQNLFVINSAMSFSRIRALTVATVVFLFDMSLTLGAFFGMGSLLSAFPLLRSAVLLVGSLFVIRIGVGLLLAKGRELTREESVFSLKKIIATAFVVTWFNPQALIDTTLFFGAFRASLPPQAVRPFVSGCLTASPLWFVSITLIVSALRSRLGTGFLRALNVVCGSVITFYGGKLLWEFAKALL